MNQFHILINNYIKSTWKNNEAITIFDKAIELETKKLLKNEKIVYLIW